MLSIMFLSTSSSKPKRLSRRSSLRGYIRQYLSHQNGGTLVVNIRKYAGWRSATKVRRCEGDQCIGFLSAVSQYKLLDNIDVLFDTMLSVPVVIGQEPVIIIL
jgi:hypothetical protein